MRASCPVPLLEPVAGGLWWIVGASAFDSGTGTVVLATGIGITVWLLVTLRREGVGRPVEPGQRSRLLRVLGVGVALITAGSFGLGALGYGEVAVPLACGLCGLVLFALASVFDDRTLVAAGGVLLVLGAVGALLAFRSLGSGYPRGIVGLTAGAVLWLAGAVRTGLLAGAGSRSER